MSNLILLKFPKHSTVINTDHLSTILASNENKNTIIFSFLSGRWTEITISSKYNIIDKVIAKLYEQIDYKISDEIDLLDIVEEIEKDEEDK